MRLNFVLKSFHKHKLKSNRSESFLRDDEDKFQYGSNLDKKYDLALNDIEEQSVEDDSFIFQEEKLQNAYPVLSQVISPGVSAKKKPEHKLVKLVKGKYDKKLEQHAHVYIQKNPEKSKLNSLIPSAFRANKNGPMQKKYLDCQGREETNYDESSSHKNRLEQITSRISEIKAGENGPPEKDYFGYRDDYKNSDFDEITYFRKKLGQITSRNFENKPDENRDLEEDQSIKDSLSFQEESQNSYPVLSQEISPYVFTKQKFELTSPRPSFFRTDKNGPTQKTYFDCQGRKETNYDESSSYKNRLEQIISRISEIKAGENDLLEEDYLDYENEDHKNSSSRLEIHSTKTKERDKILKDGKEQILDTVDHERESDLKKETGEIDNEQTDHDLDNISFSQNSTDKTNYDKSSSYKNRLEQITSRISEIKAGENDLPEEDYLDYENEDHKNSSSRLEIHSTKTKEKDKILKDGKEQILDAVDQERQNDLKKETGEIDNEQIDHDLDNISFSQNSTDKSQQKFGSLIELREYYNSLRMNHPMNRHELSLSDCSFSSDSFCHHSTFSSLSK